ncbi:MULTISPECIES: cytochrome bc1 complex diheme cytochrome c subunit [Corynebacterium]|jgi:cytochrome c family protein|uniref:Cytochrome bc1 complex cytochrome c subunit n=2 Tax=Corynebacterium TaxID=1716 RepID=A0ABT7FPA9_9CORY|nr:MULTISPECIES: cytochrome c [Corynebacterium]EFM43204.1 menaquinol-cytochrome c reductase cytochrome c subunit [Corynebacterium accolens ATCC 49726]MCT1409309.1 cytochrome c [Corynebacterium accolens]MDK4207720.1 cytochrome c [Corynebacterium accolens]MDK4233348.1 cytochrome c [Corynebacterium accolens]MDK4246340.1 cytochrome c [Corynebacterium accolens]
MMDNNSQSAAVEQTTASAKKTRRRRKAKRTLAGGFALAIGLTGAGVLASALTPDAQVATAEKDDQALVQEGKDIYDTACITCHGANLQGIEGRGPSLVGIGAGSVYFQVHSGRMPMMSNDAQAERKAPRYTEQQTLALAAYVAANGGGADIVYNDDGSIAQESLRGANYNGQIQAEDVAKGSELFRMNCASCHNFTGQGGALSSGKYAPELAPANEQEIYQAMLTGPQNMPKFSDRQLTADEKKDIIAYLKSAEETPSPAGWDLGGLGPVAEGLAMWIIGISALCAAAMWIGSRS